MNERIKELRKHLGLNQTEFGEKIGAKQATVAGWEVKRREPSDLVINTICTTFDVNEEWLRTGEGEMFKEPDESFITLSGRMEKEGSDFTKELTKILWSLDEEELLLLKKIVGKIKNSPDL